MNPVYSYLTQNKGKKLSIRNMSKNLNLKKKAIVYYCHKDIRIRRVSGIEVGSNKYKTAVFTIDP